MDGTLFYLLVSSFLLSFIVASFGNERKIGFWGALIVSLFFSPIIGFIVVFLSAKKKKPKKLKVKADKLYNKALISYKGGNNNKAIEILKKANAIEPNNPTILIGLAYNYSVLGNYSEAIDYIERAVESGYNKFENILEHKDFEGLRKTKEFESFVKNGYKQKNS